MFILYDLIFLVVALIYLPAYLFRRKFHRGFWARMGFIHWQKQQARPIWIHAVSVGEAASIRGLVAGLKKAYPQKQMIISTVTATGNKIARSMASGNDLVTYLPLDFSFIVRRVINKANPELFIIAETEIWPNLISYLYKKNIPVIVVNGRVSDASFKGYMLIRFLLCAILNKVSLFCMQAERDAQRLLRLGVIENKIKVTGNMKFDIEDHSGSEAGVDELRKKLGLGPQDKLLIAASTHPGEEEIILNVYQDVLRDHPGLRLLIAPRHPERCAEVINLIKKFDFEALNLSSLDLAAYQLTGLGVIFILDTVGHLMEYYAVSDIVFVGGSLAKTGGHNILEPASLGKPIIFGPHMFNFRDISGLFLNNHGAILSEDGRVLAQKVRSLLDNPGQAQELGSRARGLLAKNQGATTRNIGLLADIIAVQISVIASPEGAKQSRF